MTRALLLLVIALLGPGLAKAQDVSAPLTRIAFGSCADEERPQPIWNAILAYRPDLFLFVGDNVYGDYRDALPVHGHYLERHQPGVCGKPGAWA